MKVEDLRIEAPFAVPEAKTRQVQTVVDLNISSSTVDWNNMSVKIFQRIDSESSAPSWLSHAQATFSPLPTAEEQQVSFDSASLHARRARGSNDQLISQVYEKLASIGLKFGPIFRSCEQGWMTELDTTLLAKVKVPPPDDGQGQYILHPVVLDAMIQSIIILKLTRNLKKKLFEPIRIGKFVWLAENKTEETFVYAYDNGPAGDGVELSTTNCTSLLLDGNSNVLAIMTGVEFIDTTVKAIEAVLEQQKRSMPDIWEEVWRPSIGPLQFRQNLQLCNPGTFADEKFNQDMVCRYNNLDPDQTDTFQKLEKLAHMCMLRAMLESGWEPPKTGTIFSQKELAKQLGIKEEFHQFFGFMLEVLKQEGILVQAEDAGPDMWKVAGRTPTLEDILSQLNNEMIANLTRKMHVTLLLTKVGENLSQILTGKQSPLYILFPDESKKEHPSARDFYDEFGNLFKIEQFVIEVSTRWLEYWNQQQFQSGERLVMRVLEICAGTGSYTAGILETFEKSGIEFEYTFTDISAVFFPPAEKKFEKWGKQVRYKKLNIEEDPISQGFVPGYFDCICASDVIHATRDIRESLRNLRTLLKPMGRLDILEMTRANRFVTYLFGLLDGFWRFEDKDLRPTHCTMPIQKWAEAFVSTGFEMMGVISCVNDHHSFMAARKSNYNPCLATSKSNKIWLVFHQNDSPTSSFMIDQIQSATNRQVVTLQAGDKFYFSANKFIVRKDSEEDFLSVMGKIEGSTVEGIVYCWSLDKKAVTQNDILQPYFYLSKSISSLKQNASPRLRTLTNKIVPFGDDFENFHQSTICGFTKSLQSENIGLNCRVIDIGGDEEDPERNMQIFYEIWNTDKETQVAYNGTTRYCPKIQPHKPTLAELKLPSGTGRFQLILPETNSISDLQFGPLDPLVLGDEEVEIQVKASALNFRDVLNILKPTDEFKKYSAVGFDFAGSVKRVGSKVSKWLVGDAVFGINLHGNALPSHDQEDVLPVGDEMTFCEAATLPAVFATSYHCLYDVAKVTSKDTVLIHAASGGVGLSAIQLCRHLGAKIICTAGSKRKQNYLKSLGIQHIFHSRNTSYGEEILELTEGRGVDVVLNSLTSEGFKEVTLMACAKRARFIEMSKLSIWQPDEVKRLRPDVDYTIVDVSALDRVELRGLISNIKQLADEKIVTPIPYVKFDSVNIRQALHYMQKAKHIGKVVCVMPELKPVNGQTLQDTPMFNQKSTYLIKGGLGGIGFEVCKWMVEKGAKYVLLAGRSLPSTTMIQAILQLNAQNDAKVASVRLDVGDFFQCKKLIQYQIQAMGYPQLRGVMHCAGTLHDGLIQNQEWLEFSSTFKTKVDGTLNLHVLTKDCRLEHFVLFSSIASAFGSPGQSNHAAGNNFEDMIAHYRNSVGLPATTINWGQWGQVGVATEVDLPGLKPFSTLQALSGLEFALKSHRTQTGVVNIESFVLLSKLFPHISCYLDERVWRTSVGSSSSLIIKSREFWEQYDSKGETGEKLQLLQETIRTILKNILKLDAADVIQDDQSFQEMGVDSLMFVEIKNALQTVLGDRVTVNASALRDCNNVKLLSETLVKLIEGDDLMEVNCQPPTSEEVSSLIRDCELPEHIRAKEGQKLIRERDIKCVLLTGCTGTLGPYVLTSLCSLPQISNVICLVRSGRDQYQSGEERLRAVLENRDLLEEIDMRKVSVVKGDVASDKLGMEPGIWEELCDKVEAIFHCAVSVQHVENYRKHISPGPNDMRAVNIRGTKNVLEFSSSGNILKHVFLASTLLAVPKLDQEGILSEDWPEVGDFDGLTTIAYPITKFVGEILMKKAVQERGIPGKVFRYPFIVGDSKSGRFILNQNHLMLRYMFIMKTGMMPSNPAPLTVIPVDVCAEVGVKLAVDKRFKDGIINILHKRPDTDQEFVQVAKRLGYNVDIVEFFEFAQKIRDSSLDDSPFSIFREFYRNDEDLMSLYTSIPAIRQWLLEGGSEEKQFFYSRKIAKLIPDFYDKLDGCMECIERDLLFARKQGWLQKYGLS